MNLIKLSAWAKKNGYSYRGAYNRFNAGRIDGAFKNETGFEANVFENKFASKTLLYLLKERFVH